ncbi:MAG: cell division protein FtsA, partial [Deltaproteobacteria bacterium]|nr:cell division protein FtsA [Deltaproteobacteria bacterium]
MSSKNSLAVGLDIGTYKTSAVVAEYGPQGVEIIGIGTALSQGLRKGVVVNIDATVRAVRKAVEEAQLMAGCEIYNVFAGIAGAHVQGFNSHGMVVVKNQEVGADDVSRVIDAAQAVALPIDRQVLHVLPQEFIVDGQDGVKEPVGLWGVRLEAKVHIVTVSVTSAQNVVKCCERAGLHVRDLFLEPLASAEAVLTPEEKELGVVLLDIGGGTTDIVVFYNGAVRHTSVLAVGGYHFTNDLALGLHTPLSEAEKIKQRHGCALADMILHSETIEVPSVGGRTPRILPRQALGEIIEPRAEEIFTLIKRELAEVGCQEVLASGVVLTGGSALMEGMPELAERIFRMPVRRGTPIHIGGLVDVVNSP